MSEKAEIVEKELIDRRSTIPLILIDENREIVGMSEAAEELTGCATESVAGRRHCYDVLRCRDAQGGPMNGNCPGVRCFRYHSRLHNEVYTVTDSGGQQVKVVSDYEPLSRPVDGRRMAIIRMETLPMREQRVWRMREPYQALIFVLGVLFAAALFLLGRPYG